MRHGFAFRKLSRNPEQRMRLLKNLATSLFEHERIQTTLARGKELRRFAEKLITVSTRGTPGAHAKVDATIPKASVAEKVKTVLAERYATRSGGYTRLWRSGLRRGDGAPLSIVELVDNPTDMRAAFARYAAEARAAEGACGVEGASGASLIRDGARDAGSIRAGAGGAGCGAEEGAGAAITRGSLRSPRGLPAAAPPPNKLR